MIFNQGFHKTEITQNNGMITGGLAVVVIYGCRRNDTNTQGLKPGFPIYYHTHLLHIKVLVALAGVPRESAVARLARGRASAALTGLRIRFQRCSPTRLANCHWLWAGSFKSLHTDSSSEEWHSSWLTPDNGFEREQVQSRHVRYGV